MKDCDFSIRARLKGWDRQKPDEITDWLVEVINRRSQQVTLTNGRVVIGVNMADYDMEFYIVQYGKEILG